MDGLVVIEGDGMHNYTDCGLDYVWLRNGFEYRDTARGRLVRVNDTNGLHAAIARWIVSSPGRLRGQEVRFLRSMLGLSQEGLGKLLRESRATVDAGGGSRRHARDEYDRKGRRAERFGDRAHGKGERETTELGRSKHAR